MKRVLSVVLAAVMMIGIGALSAQKAVGTESTIDHWEREGIKQATKTLQWWREACPFIASAGLYDFLDLVDVEDASIVVAYRDGTLDTLVRSQLDTFKLLLAGALDEQEMRKATAYVAMNAAKDAYKLFYDPFILIPRPSFEAYPLRFLSIAANDLYFQLRDSINSWYNEAQLNLSGPMELLYQQATIKWEQALQQVESAGYVDTTNVERDAARMKGAHAVYYINTAWLRSGDFQPGKSATYLKTQIDQIYLQTGIFYFDNNMLASDDYALVAKEQAGTLDAEIAMVNAAIMAILQRDLTAQAYQDVAHYFAVMDGSWALSNLHKQCRNDESAGLYYVFLVATDYEAVKMENAINPLPAQITSTQWDAIQKIWNQMIEAYYTPWNVPYLTYSTASIKDQYILWGCVQIGDVLGLNLRPIIGDFPLPPIPVPPDPPKPPPSHFWDNWPMFLQWILKYLLFGWLWMRWA